MMADHYEHHSTQTDVAWLSILYTRSEILNLPLAEKPKIGVFGLMLTTQAATSGQYSLMGLTSFFYSEPDTFKNNKIL